MLDAKPHDFPQEARQSIMKSLIEFDSLVYARDINLDDLHPRNVMITNPGDKAPRIIFINFGDMLWSATL